MAAYALVEGGKVINMIAWDGNVEEWGAPDGVAAIAVPEGSAVGIGYSYDGEVFTAPPAPPPPLATTADVLAQRDVLLAMATLRIAPLQDAADLDDATAAETAALKAWKQYRVALNRIESATGFPAAVVWPVAPN